PEVFKPAFGAFHRIQQSVCPIRVGHSGAFRPKNRELAENVDSALEEPGESVRLCRQSNHADAISALPVYSAPGACAESLDAVAGSGRNTLYASPRVALTEYAYVERVEADNSTRALRTADANDSVRIGTAPSSPHQKCSRRSCRSPNCSCRRRRWRTGCCQE